MFKEAVRNVNGLEFYPTVSFVIFFLFFIGLMFYVYGFTKKHTDEMGNLPFDDQNTLNETKNDKNEKNI